MKRLILDSTLRSLQAVLGGAVTTSQPEFVASYVDKSSTTLSEASNVGAFNNTTPVTLVAAPASGHKITVLAINIYNKDTVATTVTLSYNDNSTLRTIWKGILQPGEVKTVDGVFDATGALKTISDLTLPLASPPPIGSTAPNTGKFTTLQATTSLFVAPSGSIDASAVAQVDSTTKGFLPPRMTTTQRDAISSPANGLTVYDTTLNRPACYLNGAWYPVGIFTIKPRSVLGADQASVSISIPSIFNEAWIRFEGRSDYGTGTIDNLLAQFNGDTTAGNYYTEYGTDVGATPVSGESLGGAAGILIGLALPCNTATAGNGAVLIKVTNLQSTTLRRAVTWEGTVQQGTTTGLIRAINGGGYWQNTSNAITTVLLKPSLGSNFKQNSAYSVLGVF